MKKWFVLLASVGILAACNNGEEDLEEQSVTEESEEEVVEEPEEETIEELAFVPQFSDYEVEHEEEQVLVNIREFVEENNEALGEAGEVSLDLSNEIIFPESQSDLRGIVLVSNRTEEPVSNFGFEVTIESDEGTTFTESHSIYLSEEHFGVLEPHTVMPVYVPLSPEYIEELAHVVTDQTGYAEMDNLHFEEMRPENSDLGYNPVYVAEQSQAADQGNQETEGTSGEFELLVPEAEPDLQENPTNLVHLQMITDNYAAMVRDYEQDWMDIWSGMVTVDPETNEMQGYFLLVNDLGEDVQDLSFTLGLLNETTGEMIIEGVDVSLPAEEYGVWEDQTVMPFSIAFPDELSDEIMMFMEQEHQGIPVTENLEYESAE
jgi:molybdopterin converting factor small subunit